MLEELGLKRLQGRRSIAKLKMLHRFYSNLRFKPILGRVKVYDGLFFPSTFSLWNKCSRHIVNTARAEQFSDHVSEVDLHHLA